MTFGAPRSPYSRGLFVRRFTMPTTPAGYPDVTSREDWLAARKKLLTREREVTHLRDAVNAERRRLPMVKVDKDYVFEGPDGEVTLLDIFEGRNQLYIHQIGRAHV